MPRIINGKVRLTADEAALVRGMNKTKLGWNWRYGAVAHVPQSNIAALHFDGQVLIDLLMAHRELEKRNQRA